MCQYIKNIINSGRNITPSPTNRFDIVNSSLPLHPSHGACLTFVLCFRHQLMNEVDSGQRFNEDEAEVTNLIDGMGGNKNAWKEEEWEEE